MNDRLTWSTPKLVQIAIQNTQGGVFDLDKEDSTYHNTAS